MKKGKQPGGMLGRNLKHKSRINNYAFMAIFAIAMLLVGSLFNDAIAGVAAGVASVGVIKSLAILPFVPFTLKAGETEDQLAERNLVGKILHEAEQKMADTLTLTNGQIVKLQEDLKVALAASKGASDAQIMEIAKLAGELKALKETGFTHTTSIKAQLTKFITDNHEAIKNIQRSGSGVVEFKAVADITTASATNPDGIPELVGVQVAPPTNVNLRTSIVEGLVSRFATSLAAFPYTESLPKDGDFTFLGEGDTKAQIDFKIETRYAQPKKLAAWQKLTEEAVNDIPGLISIAYDFLRKKHDLKKQNGILFGDGIGDNLKGATSYGRVFSAGGMANCVTGPNFMDVVNAAITDIFTTHNYTDEMPYMANLVMVNPIDFFCELVAAKDLNGLPLYPMASLFNRVTIGGATIVPFEDIPEGKIFVADMSKYNITDFVGYTVKIGVINDDFIKNQFVILGESRLHGFVKKLDEQAFIYDDIATIKAAITAV